jgi:hypothetical protein
VNETLVQEEGQRQECCKVQTKKKKERTKSTKTYMLI